jgi:glycosyltransferase involved in cell wall biosynthesis
VLVPPANPAALAHRLLTLLHDPTLQQQLRTGGRQALTAFSWDVLVADVERAYAYSLI